MLGRFTRPDPASSFSLFNPQSLNRYSYGLNNPLRFVDPDGAQDVEANAVLVVPVNVIYSDADKPVSRLFGGGPPLRSVTESGISYARSFLAEAGIALAVRRFEGTLGHDGGSTFGTVSTKSGALELKDFIKQNPGVNVVVSGKANLSGNTVGQNTVMGVLSDDATFNDEVNHALGNNETNVPRTLGLANGWLDIKLDVQETKFSLGLKMSSGWEGMLRTGAAASGCAINDAACKARIEYLRRTQ